MIAAASGSAALGINPHAMQSVVQYNLNGQTNIR
jgi:hypothetical protein